MTRTRTVRITPGCKLLVVGLLWCFAATQPLSAVVVRYDTSLGNVDVRLFHTATPQSVTNFLSYVNTDSWDDTFIHRSIAGFIVQGGGFSLTPDIFNTTNVASNAPVINEPVFSNLRGTLAYAKVGPPQGQPPTQQTINSATNQWFFNLSDNSANLDNQNGGFTAFGRVVGNGMSVVDSIAALQTISAGSPFTDVPVNDINTVVGQQNIFASDAVIINDVSVLNVPDGDYDFDGEVDGDDLLVWQNSIGSTVNAEADGNGNGIVDAADLAIWRANYGASAIASSLATVPEPSAIALACLALLATLHRRPLRNS